MRWIGKIAWIGTGDGTKTARFHLTGKRAVFVAGKQFSCAGSCVAWSGFFGQCRQAACKTGDIKAVLPEYAGCEVAVFAQRANCDDRAVTVDFVEIVS